MSIECSAFQAYCKFFDCFIVVFVDAIGIYINIYTNVKINSEKDNNNIRFVLHIGDLAYGIGQEYIWEQWSNLISPISLKIPYMIGIGNHEYDHEDNSTSFNQQDGSGLIGNGYHPSWGK